MRHIFTFLLSILAIGGLSAQNSAPFFHERPFDGERYFEVCERLQGGYFAHGWFRPGPLTQPEWMLVRYNAYGQQTLARSNKGNLIQYISKMLHSKPAFLAWGAFAKYDKPIRFNT